MKIKKIKIPIYYDTLVLIQGKNWGEIEEKYNISADSSWEAFCFKRKKPNKCTEYIVCFKPKVKYGVVAHEVVHLVNLIFTDMMIELDKSNDEPQAYFTGWVSAQIEKFLKKSIK